MRTKQAVITDKNLFWIEENGFHKESLEAGLNLLDLAELAYKRYVSHLWIVPETEAVILAYQGTYNSDTMWRFLPYKNRQTDETMGLSAFRDGHQKMDINILFPLQTTWGNDEESWIHKVDAQELLIVIHYLEQKLGVPIGGSPGRAGWEYLKKLQPEWTQPIDYNFKTSPFMEPIGDKAWHRAMSVGEFEVLYIHKFDKSSAFPYAASKSNVGTGVPFYVDHGLHAEPMNDKQSVGIWYCSVIYGEVDPTMPYIVQPGEKKDLIIERWLHGPTIQTLRSAGHLVNIRDGWVFPGKSRVVLDKWANDLWSIRVGFDSPKWKNQRCARFAQEAMKQIMNDMIGLVGFREFEVGDEKMRPDMRGQVIAKHKQLMWHNISHIRDLYDITPIAQQSDAVYYLSNNPDGRAVLPALVKREGQLGGYKYEGKIAMATALNHTFNERTELPPFVGTVRELLADDQYSWNYKLNVLNTAGWK